MVDDEIVAYALEPYWFRKLQEIEDALHGKGAPLTSDQRRDLANLMSLTLSNVVALEAGDTL